MQRHRLNSGRQHRRGSLMPAVAVALLVITGLIGLVLDQLWLSAAKNELQTAANAAALAAAHEMAHEDLLKIDYDVERRADAIRKIAKNSARRNAVAGGLAAVSLEPHRDVRLGRPVLNSLTGATAFIETEYAPTSVIVMTHRDRRSGNPVSLFMPYLTGQPVGDVRSAAEASISNRISGVRPFDNANVPAWPIAVLSSDGDQQDDWNTAIETRLGQDQFGWDRSTGKVIPKADGIPEMTLKTGTGETNGNVCLVDIGSKMQDNSLRTQLREGLSWEDLQDFESELSFAAGPIQFHASSDLFGVPVAELKQQIGQARIILLYDQKTDGDSGDLIGVTASRLVAVRLLKITEHQDEVELIVQPAIVTSRTAVLADLADDVLPNPYIYRLALTQ